MEVTFKPLCKGKDMQSVVFRVCYLLLISLEQLWFGVLALVNPTSATMACLVPGLGLRAHCGNMSVVLWRGSDITFEV